MQTISENRRARFDYEILETFEAGIELSGLEVKSAKRGGMQIAGSHGIIRSPRLRSGETGGGEAYLVNSRIPPYQPQNTPSDYNPSRTRKLLLHKDEISKLVGSLKQKLSLIPLRAYLKNNFVKIELGLARPKKKRDKRESIKKVDARREMKKFRD